MTTWQRWRLWQQRLKPVATKPVVTKPVPPPLQPVPPGYKIFVLCYHEFRPQTNRWAITPRRLEAHLQMLKALGFTFLTMSEAVDLMQGHWRGPLPKRAVAITVDDGYQSAYTVLFPLLKRYKAKATLFVYTEWIGKGRGALTWEQLREMAASGLVEIASHTVTHPYPRWLHRRLPPEQYRRTMLWEFEQSKRLLEKQLGNRIVGLAYPGGYVDGALKALAQRAGYRWAVAINPKPFTAATNPYAIPRYAVSEATTVVALRAWVLGQPLQLALKEPEHNGRIVRRSEHQQPRVALTAVSRPNKPANFRRP